MKNVASIYVTILTDHAKHKRYLMYEILARHARMDPPGGEIVITTTT